MHNCYFYFLTSPSLVKLIAIAIEVRDSQESEAPRDTENDNMLSKRLQMLVRNLLCFYNRHRRQSSERWLCVTGLLCLVIIYQRYRARDPDYPGHVARVEDSEGRVHSYHSLTSPLVFIGGHPRSGTTLMRAILDSHDQVRCGEESRIIPRVVSMREAWLKNEKEAERLTQGGIDKKVIDSALTSFILETIANHGEPAPVLCNKDPLTLKWGSYMADLFPNSKWLFMMRDGRAVIHSVITRKVTISGFKLDEPRQCLGRWNKIVENMNNQCNAIGPTRCMIVYYEQLVLHPKKWISLILDFLDLPWDERVLHHEQSINKPRGVRVSKVERSSDQIIKPINSDALTSWVGYFDEDILEDMDAIAPMLRKFGYDPEDNDPVYGVPDGEVINNTNDIHDKKQYWENKARELLSEMDKTKDYELD